MSWRACRAALLAVVVGYSLLAAIPTPNPNSLNNLRSANARSEVSAWLPWAKRLGVADNRAEFERIIVRWSARLDGWHRALAHVWRPVFKVARTGQRWKLFSTPSAIMHRFIVLGRRDAAADIGWFRLYARNDPEHDWLSDTLGYRRIRTIHEGATRSRGAMYTHMSAWIARRAFADDPTLTAVRIGHDRWRADTPVRRTKPKWTGGAVYYRDTL